MVGVLVAVAGKLEGEVYRVFDGDNKLGRGSDCRAVLPSQRISREHCLLRYAGGRFTIEPLSAKNPTLVNGERTRGTELKDGDSLELADTTFRFRSVD